MKKLYLFIIVILFSSCLFGIENYREIRLKNKWKFKIGDDMTYAEADYDDSNWGTIRIKKRWEDQGYPGYDGYAWYRTEFYLPEKYKQKSLSIQLGAIDDVDAVYINGQYIGGTGSFPPRYISAYGSQRRYHLPEDVLEYGKENVIAVRVYDSQESGGILWGNIGIYSEFRVHLYSSIAGKWKFSPGDDQEWARTDYDDSGWDTIQVPSTWEAQDYTYLDGYAWYRHEFRVNRELEQEDLILVLGLIDDIDEVYFNGVRIGQTGQFPGERTGYGTNHYKDERFYYLPSKLIHWDRDNLIAVRVFDTGGSGGIYEGPVGITTRKEFLRYKREKKRKKTSNFFDELFNEIFGD